MLFPQNRTVKREKEEETLGHRTYERGEETREDGSVRDGDTRDGKWLTSNVSFGWYMG